MRPDAEIAATIANMLKWHVTVEQEKIRIKVDHGIVTLEGHVEGNSQRQAVEECVRCLPGVIRLDNFISPEPSGTAGTARRFEQA